MKLHSKPFRARSRITYPTGAHPKIILKPEIKHSGDWRGATINGRKEYRKNQTELTLKRREERLKNLK